MRRGSKQFLLIVLIAVGGLWYAYDRDIGNVREYIKVLVTTTSRLDESLLNNKSLALSEARKTFQNSLDANVDMTQGPCLAEVLIPGWSFDVKTAATSSDPICTSFDQGVTNHLIEYDMFGNFLGITTTETL